MSFINTEVSLHDLPALEKIQLTPIHSSYLKILRIEWVISFVFLTVVAAALILFIPGIRESFWWIGIVGLYFLLTAPYYFLQEKGFTYKAYAVREKDVIYQHGWLIRNQKVCPFNRIQNCNIQAGVLERNYGLASLILYTAGTSGADMTIPGLKQEEAEQLRQYILSRINATD